MVKAFSDAVLAGEPPPRDASMFLASAIERYLVKGGSLTGKWLKIDAVPGSHHTPQVLARAIDDEDDSPSVLPEERQDE
jgi:hypothetical protein